MNDSPGWATPGPSPSDDERPGAPADRPVSGDPKWSSEQPPPGQWTSPSPGQTPPPPGPQQPPQGQGWGPYAGQYGQNAQYGGYPGGPGQWGQPPAAKPGVIPLRPLGLGEILDGAVATMRSHWRSILPITLVVATVVQVLSVLTQKYAMADLAVSPDAGATLDEAVNDLVVALGALVAVGFIAALGGIFATAMLTMIYSRAVLGTTSTVSAAWREARPQLLRLLGLTFLLGIGAVLLVTALIMPGILAESPGLALVGGLVAAPLFTWLWIKFSLASPALMLEKSTVFKALGRSSKLVQGTWWRIFGITVLTQIITGIVSAIIVWPLTIVGMAAFGGGLSGMEDGTASTAWGALILSGIGSIIAQTIVMPILSGVTVLLYVDQRIRREGLDLELARAAGIENYGTAGG
ncbi:hypothetical protein [Streptomyces subrutilus]|uniref:Glycerophosphoryl diester phosphodiesterase membrane domain-containing protein n=1 Tax=Streptomyces subrutilus TaxID=36818 RepID=A0A1E5PRP5_9ACTN|nr:hypothetical protein [Streptomyces subrutilus]OEJ32225.1 hypothetical protein BGK67_13545 [Streptomyces subrutilus]